MEDLGVGYAGMNGFAEDDLVGLVVVVDEPIESIAMMDGSMDTRLLLRCLCIVVEAVSYVVSLAVRCWKYQAFTYRGRRCAYPTDQRLIHP